MKAFKETEKPLSECPPEKDPKWRFFWRIGERPNSSKHADLNAEAVVPDGFPEWKDVMDTWGNKLLQCVRDVSEMAASGFDLPRKTFSDMMDKAPHLLGTRNSSACTSYFSYLKNDSLLDFLVIQLRRRQTLTDLAKQGLLLLVFTMVR